FHATVLPSGSHSAAAFSRFSRRRAPSTTDAPSRAAATAHSLPRPGPTPDTITTFPSSSMASDGSGATGPSSTFRPMDVHGAVFMPHLLVTALERNLDTPCMYLGEDVLTGRQVRDEVSRYAQA